MLEARPLCKVFLERKWVSLASKEIELVINNIINQQEQCNVMLTGGQSAKLLYENMTNTSILDGLNVNYYFGDERCVPKTHPESNFGMALQTLFSKFKSGTPTIYRMKADWADTGAAARDYEDILPNHMDVLLLGMGEDGHIASLFPQQEALKESSRSVVSVVGTKYPYKRLTITPKVIKQAKNVFLLARGRDKGRVLASAFSSPKDICSLPVRLTLNKNTTWLLDQAAAKPLQGIISVDNV